MNHSIDATKNNRFVSPSSILVTAAIAFAVFLVQSKLSTAARPAAFLQASSQPKPAQQPKVDKKSDSVANQIYALTKGAKTTKDFSAIIKRCEQAVSGDEHGNSENRKPISPQAIKDIDAIRAWALSKRGKSRVDLAISIRNAGNEDQFKAVINAAEVDFEDAIAISPKRWQAYFGRSLVHANLNREQAAIRDLNKVLELNQKSKKARFNRAELFSWTRQYDRAIDDYEIVIKSAPYDVQALTGLAHANLAVGQSDKAIELYTKVIAFQPGNAIALENRAEAYQAVGNWQLAYDDLQACLQQQDSGTSFLKIAWLLSTCPDPDFFQPQVAKAMAEKGVQFAGKKNVDSLEVLAAAAAANGDFDDAVRIQKQAIEKFEVARADQASFESTAEKSEQQAMQVRLASYEQGEPFLQPSAKRD